MIIILNNDIVEHVKINAIKKEIWLNYFQDLWIKHSEILIQQQSNNEYTEPTTEEELDTALRKLKNNKVPDKDGLNSVLFMRIYSTKKHTIFLILFGMMSQPQEVGRKQL
jgi:hypothetical protein